LGLDPYLQGVGYTTRVRVLTGFAARLRRGAYGRGKRVQAGTVVGALTAVGQEIALACGENPTKVLGSDKILPRLQQIYDGWRKEDPAITKQLPVEANVPELLAERGRRPFATERDRAVGDLTHIAFYYLLWIGEHTIKGTRNEMKQTVQFKREDITFFKKNRLRQLRCLPHEALDHLIATADGAALKLDNKKTGGKRVERGLRLPRGKWGRLQLPSAGTGTPVRTPPTAWGECNNFSVNILDGWCPDGCNSGKH
jgi:hypothetical protein